MSIVSFISRKAVQDAVYWGSPSPDGQGGFSFADPIEIKCRWEETKQVVTDTKGNEITSRAVIFVLQDIDEEGYLMLGTLETLYDLAESSAKAIEDPKEFLNTFIIKRFKKTPALGSTTDFLRVGYLTPSLSFGGF